MTGQTSPTYRSTAKLKVCNEMFLPKCFYQMHIGYITCVKPRENIKVCVNVSWTSYRQATDRLPTHYQQSADCQSTVGRQVAYISGKTCQPVGQLLADKRPTVSRLSADRRPTVGRQLTDSQPTGFLGSSSSQLPLLPERVVPIYPIDSLHCLKWLIIINTIMIIVLMMIKMIIIIIIMMIIIIIIIVNILIIGILPISGQNRHPSTEHDQYKVAEGSSTCYTGIVPQRSHPQGKMGEVAGKLTKQWAWYCLAFSSYCTSGAG